MTTRRNILRSVSLLGLSTLAPLSIQAQAWPAQPIKLVVTFPPGGSSDIVARLLAPALSDKLGQSVVVENRPGGATTIGAAQVANAEANGYTLLISNSAPMSISPALMDKPLYDPVRSFRHLTYVGDVPTVLVVHPSLHVTDFASFLAWAKAQKDPVPFGSGGAASVGHIVGEMLAQQAGLKMLHVPYRGAGPMRTDLLGGQLKMAIDALPANLQFRKSGQLRLLAVSAERRVSQANDIPTFAELGYPKLVAENFVGVSAPAALPAAVAQTLLKALSEVMAMPDIRSKLIAQGFELENRTPEAFTNFIKDQAALWAPIVKASGATL
jgi:tripartite-type tricarboxylate transporter receptor subunit TctC